MLDAAEGPREKGTVSRFRARRFPFHVAGLGVERHENGVRAAGVEDELAGGDERAAAMAPGQILRRRAEFGLCVELPDHAAGDRIHGVQMAKLAVTVGNSIMNQRGRARAMGRNPGCRSLRSAASTACRRFSDQSARKIVRVVEIAAGQNHDFVGGGYAAETGARERFPPERLFGQAVGQKSDPAGAVFAVPAGPRGMVS